MAGIEDKELMGLSIGSVDGFSAHPDACLSVGIDNMNAARCVAKGKTRSKCARMLLSPFLTWCVKLGAEVVAFYPRTDHKLRRKP